MAAASNPMQTASTTPTVSSDPLLGHRYRFQSLLGRGGMGDVYRMHDRLTGQDVALKLVLGEAEDEDQPAAPTRGSEPTITTPPVAQDEAITIEAPQQNELWLMRRRRSKKVVAAERLALANEFRLLASLRHPHIISVLDYGFEGDDPYFTMELMESPKTLGQAARDLDIKRRCALLVQVLEALTYLHRRGVIHRDLKPSNVLVSEGRAKVCDFGISQERQQSADRISGTIAYLAPEVLRGQPASESSDLFSVGVMLYELCVGNRPFEGATTAELVNQILEHTPNLSRPEIPRPLVAVLERLLAKAPEDRYAKADIVIGELCAAAGLARPVETSLIRESFLKAATLVGRDKEIAILESRLNGGLNGRGGAVLLSGESGVGKSRLIDETKSRALIRGANVVSGQAVSDGGGAYESWRSLFRWLSLRTDLTEFEASVLSPFVPDLERLFGRKVEAPASLDPSIAQQRLIRVVEGLIRRQESPLVLVFEDVHWARSDSLTLLHSLLPVIAELPVLFLLTCRPAELSPTAKLESLDTVAIERLSNDAITDLARSVLGEVKNLEPLVARLRSESEGNVFFFIEVLRELAETAGRLDAVTEMELPEDLFVGGIRELLSRRLGRVAEHDRQLLRIAAVAGRRIDRQLLATLSEIEDIDSWLRRCADAAVLEVRDENWRFSHDRLRDAAMQETSARERRSFHRDLARGIEDLYGRKPERMAELAYHWSRGVEANRPEVAEMAIDCLESAASAALQAFANQEALEYLESALTLTDGGRPDWLAKDETRANPVAVPVARRATWMRQRGAALRALSRLPESQEALERGLVLLGRKNAVPEPLISCALACRPGHAPDHHQSQRHTGTD